MIHTHTHTHIYITSLHYIHTYIHTYTHKPLIPPLTNTPNLLENFQIGRQENNHYLPTHPTLLILLILLKSYLAFTIRNSNSNSNSNSNLKTSKHVFARALTYTYTYTSYLRKTAISIRRKRNDKPSEKYYRVRRAGRDDLI